VAIALLTTYLADYRVPLYERLYQRHGVEVLCYGGGERYVPAWFADLDRQLEAAPFPARRIHGAAQAFAAARRYEAVIAPFAGGAILPAAYCGAPRFVLWASVWAQPRSLRHDVAWPVTRQIYRGADAVVAYGDHVRRFVAGIRGRDDDVFVAPQSVEPELFARVVGGDEVAAFRSAHGLGDGPLALYVGRLVPEKGVSVLLEAWRRVHANATLVVIGDGALADGAAATPGVRFLGPLPRADLPAAYAAASFALLPSVPTPLFREPWGLVCNEAMHQGRPMIASTSVGAVAGELVVDRVNGLVVAPDDPVALAEAIAALLGDEALRGRLGAAAREAVAPYTYDAMADAFGAALAIATATAISPSPTGP
jgi:glycosyltransferase involved in cell wall biosynthesis